METPLDKTDHKSLIIRYLEGDATTTEKDRLYKWIRQNPQNRKEFYRIKEIFYSSATHLDKNSVNRSLERLHAKLQKENQEEKITRSKKLIGSWIRYAAVFVIALGTGWWIASHQTPEKQYEIKNFSGVHSLELPDGSKVWMNAQTEIRYQENPKQRIRLVELEGEAFFKVAKDPSKPFIVETSLSKIKVTGTSFNVTSYRQDNRETVTLASGQVEYFPLKNREGIIMAPKDQITAYRGGEIRQTTGVDISLSSSWRNGIYRFVQTPLEELTQKLEKIYDVDIQILDPGLAQQLYTGMFKYEYAISDILEIINLSTPIAYRFEDKTIYLSNK